MEKQKFIATTDDTALRLDLALVKRYPECSRNYIHYLFDKKMVSINGRIEKKRAQLKIGDVVDICFLNLPKLDLKPQNIPLDVIYEDCDILVINKPRNLVCHPAPGSPDNTLANALVYRYPNLADDTLRPGLIHRLDKDTSGVMIIAKHTKALELFSALFAKRVVKKEYLSICVGKPCELTIDAPIGRHESKRKEMTVSEKGKPAQTDFEIIKYDSALSLVKSYPKSGRTHQIRVHLKALNSPILGDPVYGSIKANNNYGISTPLLHAHRLELTHPVTSELIAFHAPIPDDMSSWIDKISS